MIAARQTRQWRTLWCGQAHDDFIFAASRARRSRLVRIHVLRARSTFLINRDRIPDPIEASPSDDRRRVLIWLRFVPRHAARDGSFRLLFRLVISREFPPAFDEPPLTGSRQSDDDWDTVLIGYRGSLGRSSSFSRRSPTKTLARYALLFPILGVTRQFVCLRSLPIRYIIRPILLMSDSFQLLCAYFLNSRSEFVDSHGQKSSMSGEP